MTTSFICSLDLGLLKFKPFSIISQNSTDERVNYTVQVSKCC